MIQKMITKMDGWKTIIGGLLFIMLAILALLSCLLPEVQMTMVEKALDFFALGFATLGIGSKLQKVIDKE